METFLLDNQTLPDHPRAVALGVFDGLHIGHRAVIAQAVGVEDAVPTVFTFRQPSSTLPKEHAVELLSPEGRAEVLESIGVEELIEADFAQIRDLSPETFVRQILHGRLRARRVCCGFNFHFGKGGAGDADTLAALCRACGIETVTVDPVLVDGEPVSASRIRRAVEQGEVPMAGRLLGRPFTIDFEVVGGQRLGRLLGAPTINQPLPPHFVQPRFGVYASSVIADGRVYHGVTNVGRRPTVSGDDQPPLAETWIPGYSGDLYGQHVPVSLTRFLRPESKFGSLDALQDQILRDEAAARPAAGGGRVRAVLFDFDDTLQNRPAAFRGYARSFLARYFPSLSAPEREQHVEDMLERNQGGYVAYLDYFRQITTALGWPDAPVETIFRLYQRQFPQHVTLFPDTVPVLRSLRTAGYRLGLITNGPSVMQNRKLDYSGLRPFFDVTLVSGDEGVHKPDPEIFRRAASRLGLACEACVFVGDHPVNDIQGAQEAGMRPVYINPFGVDVHPAGVTEITRLAALPALLETL